MKNIIFLIENCHNILIKIYITSIIETNETKSKNHRGIRFSNFFGI